MPTTKNYIYFIFVNLGFLIQIIAFTYFSSIIDIKKNWALYRCIPTYWIFSDDISADFTYCIQNTQLNLMGTLMKPFYSLVNNLTSLGSTFSTSINNIRNVISNVRTYVSNIISYIVSIFMNIIIEFQKLIISIKDVIGKMIGIVMTMLYILDGSIKTMNSAWKGPTGQIVRSIGSCFHPETKIKLKNGQIYDMQDVPLSSILEDNSKVFAVLKIDNVKNENYYIVKGGVNQQNIFVTGNHYIYDIQNKLWTKVKDYSKSIPLKDETYKTTYFTCLITTNGKIKIGDNLFWDWEDDVLN